MKKNNIILLATFWNEIEWIDASLAQIEKVKPIEVIICDGNFDPSVPNYSTDGTREKIIDFCQKTTIPCQVIEAVRLRPGAIKGLKILQEAGCRNSHSFSLPRFKMAIITQLKLNIYRVNQALTFSKMCRLSKEWKEGNWVMTYDADQFYSDTLIDSFSATIDKSDKYDLITADELTFPYSFDRYTLDYEVRKWNNLPHKIKKSMAVYPTRHLVIEEFMSARYPQNLRNALHGGSYHHYKFRSDLERIKAGYSLGDRQPPDLKRYSNLRSSANLQFPEIIRKHYPHITGSI